MSLQNTTIYLLDLPAEILHIILFYSTLTRGVKRALRLRLVCRVFARMTHAALFETELMDKPVFPPIGTNEWNLQTQHGGFELWRGYLVYRCLREKDRHVGRFVDIRTTAEFISGESGLDFQYVLKELCGLALSHNRHIIKHRKRKLWGPLVAAKEKAHACRDLYILTAATHFNIPALVQRSLAELVRVHHDPTHHTYLFASPMQVAAQAGNTAMLQLFQRSVFEPYFDVWSVQGAAMRGDMDILKAALQIDNDNTIQGETFGSIDHSSGMGYGIRMARRFTTNPEVYEYLTSALAPWEEDTETRYGPWRESLESSYGDLIHHSGLGNMAMVKYFLGRGVPVQKHTRQTETPLIAACQGLHHDIVDALLSHGADPNFAANKTIPHYALHESATMSSLTLARKLLDHGALPDPPANSQVKYPALFWAFARENEPMIRLLLSRGATLSVSSRIEDGSRLGPWRGNLGQHLAEIARHLGSTWITDLLCEHGVVYVEPSPFPPPEGPSPWAGWAEARAIIADKMSCN
ncbi:ankyrin [Hypoxylon trugodes]|uniref:ankyrin n=1 Tax=Hypoxylon trugodes TaxID=326681 RepID=UPI0021937AD5|nr:ankyrin [Hypoxylon trugodes]KAI1385948.1 ankyrin [Hypoxylon trugodes]